jgi:ankyrin repeat protein
LGSLSEATIRLHKAILDRNVEAVDLALADGADVHAVHDEDGYTILSFLDDPNILKLLLDAGANPNQPHHGESPDVLYWAVSAGRLEIVKMLIAAGASVEAELREYRRDPVDWEWEGSVHVAAREGYLEIVRILLESGGKSALNCFDYVSRTPLMIAVERGDFEMARLFIEAGADVNAHDEVRIGDTALKYAVESQGLEMIKLLLDAGADPRITGWMRLNSFDKAKSRQGKLGAEILELLMKYPNA